MTGKNPSFPDVANDSITITNELKADDPFLERMSSLKTARLAAREIEVSG